MASDCSGRPVVVGTRVRVLVVARFLKQELPPDEWRELETMAGEVFEVFEIDEYGAAWVEKWWDAGDGQRHSHSLALESEEMEVAERSDG
jgi:hypothetical protein